MALFTKLRQKFGGGNVKFDDIDLVATAEDEKEGNEKDTDKNTISVFRREPAAKSSILESQSFVKKSEKFINIMPGSENVPPRNQIDSSRTENASGKSNAGNELTKDNRFATSRTVSFHRISSNNNLVDSGSVKTKVESTPLTFEDVVGAEVAEEEEAMAHQNESDISIDSTTEQDKIELVFSKARHNHMDAVLEALQTGFNINTVDSYGNTLMHVCAQNNHRKLASALLQNFPTCNINKNNLKSLTPLDYAEKYGFQKMSSWLKGVGGIQGPTSTAQFSSQPSSVRLR
jgi:hypothetical protein